MAVTTIDEREDQVKHQFLTGNARKRQHTMILEQKQVFPLQNPNKD